MQPSNLFTNKGEDHEERPPARSSRLNRFNKLAAYWPLLILIAFLWVLWSLFGDRFQSSRSVELVSVVTQRAAVEAAPEARAESSVDSGFEASTLFQASGWIEPDPLPIRVTALYGGVVETVEVLEGEAVEEGQLLATLIDEDARLDLQTAEAALGEAAASSREAEALVQVAEAALKTLALDTGTAEARLAELIDEADRLERGGRNVFPERDVVQAQLRVRTQQSRVESLEVSGAELRADLKAKQAMAAAARNALERAEVDRARKQLALERTRIYSPIDGVIQHLYATPGMKRMLGMDDLDSATILRLYRPDSLQARIDVPLEEAAGLFVGQAVRLRTSLFPNREFKGRVTRILGQADLQRNTLQAKVSLLDPDPKLRPEMLCRAEFLASGPSTGGAPASGSGRVAIYVSEAALLDSGGSTSVWMLDASGERVVRQSIELGDERREGHIRVRTGLKPGDRVVLHPPEDLEAGERIHATDEN